MKLIKKIAAIMFAFMLVFSLSTNAKADENSGDSTATGTITIENSNAGQTYNLYRILDLESYNNVDKVDWFSRICRSRCILEKEYR